MISKILLAILNKTIEVRNKIALAVRAKGSMLRLTGEIQPIESCMLDRLVIRHDFRQYGEIVLYDEATKLTYKINRIK